MSVNSMFYWYAECLDLRIIDSLNIAMLAEYAKLTGIQRGSAEDLKEAYELKNLILNECPNNLENAVAEIAKLDRQKRRWRTISLAGIPIGIGIGAVGTLILITRL